MITSSLKNDIMDVMFFAAVSNLINKENNYGTFWKSV